MFFCYCTSRKNLTYFQGDLIDKQLNKYYSPKLKPDDILSIIIMGQDEISVKPFNLLTNNINQAAGGYNTGNATPPGYLIDNEGFVEMPVIGKIKLGGLSREEAINHIKEKLTSYLKNPTIILRILNYKVTVLGEVKNPGTFTIPNERITLLEAIGIAGDLQITGLRKNVIVIREEDGVRTETSVDLTKKDLFYSPVYYLQQNDVVYIEPNRAKRNSSLVNATNVGLTISIISLLVTLAVLFTK